MASQKHMLTNFIKYFNPWLRIRMMGTNIAQGTMARIWVAFIVLPLISTMRVERGIHEF